MSTDTQLPWLEDDEKQAFVEANALTEEQYKSFLVEIESIQPNNQCSIDGKTKRLAFEFMEDTGLRITEMLHVRKKDIDFKTGILVVIHPKSEKQCKCSVWRYKDLYSRTKILESSDTNCKDCHGKGKWKKPQRTSFTPRIIYRLYEHCQRLSDDQLLFEASRMSWWRWGKRAGKKAGINIYQQKETVKIEGIFLHLFRALCSKRMVRDAMNDPYKDQMIATKLRHSFQAVTDRYTTIDINYLLGWEKRTYRQV